MHGPCNWAFQWTPQDLIAFCCLLGLGIDPNLHFLFSSVHLCSGVVVMHSWFPKGLVGGIQQPNLASKQVTKKGLGWFTKPLPEMTSKTDILRSYTKMSIFQSCFFLCSNFFEWFQTSKPQGTQVRWWRLLVSQVQVPKNGLLTSNQLSIVSTFIHSATWLVNPGNSTIKLPTSIGWPNFKQFNCITISIKIGSIW